MAGKVWVAVFAMLLSWAPAGASAQSAGDFYKGREVHLLVGAAAGGGLAGTVSRLLRFANSFPQVLVGDLTVTDGTGSPQLDILVAVAALRGTPLLLGRSRYPGSNRCDRHGFKFTYPPRRFF